MQSKYGYLQRLAIMSRQGIGQIEKPFIIASGNELNYSNCRRLDPHSASIAGTSRKNTLSHIHFGFDIYPFIWQHIMQHDDDVFLFDVGCGSGSALNDIVMRSGEKNVFGFGIDKALYYSEIPDRNYIVGDAARLKEIVNIDGLSFGIPCSCFDFVMSTLVMHEIQGNEDKDMFVSEIMRVLKIGGYALLTVPKIYDLMVAPYRVIGENQNYRSVILKKQSPGEIALFEDCI